MVSGKFTLKELQVRSGKTVSGFADLFDNNEVPDYKIRKELDGSSGGFSTDDKDYIAHVLKTERSRIAWL